MEYPVAEYLGLDPIWLEATDVHAPGLYEVALSDPELERRGLQALGCS